MEELWETYERESILGKFQFALLLRGAEKFDTGTSAEYGHAAALIKLRNGLTHFKPEWSNEQDEHRRISAALAGRFDPCSFFPPGEPLFPRGWTSHSCTKWAVQSVMDFVGEVVCGGFGRPLARSVAEQVIIVVGHDRQSLYAAMSNTHPNRAHCRSRVGWAGRAGEEWRGRR